MKWMAVLCGVLLVGCSAAARNPMTPPAGLSAPDAQANARECAALAERAPSVFTPLTILAFVSPIPRFFEAAPETEDGVYQNCMRAKGYHVPEGREIIRILTPGWSDPRG